MERCVPKTPKTTECHVISDRQSTAFCEPDRRVCEAPEAPSSCSPRPALTLLGGSSVAGHVVEICLFPSFPFYPRRFSNDVQTISSLAAPGSPSPHSRKGVYHSLITRRDMVSIRRLLGKQVYHPRHLSFGTSD